MALVVSSWAVLVPDFQVRFSTRVVHPTVAVGVPSQEDFFCGTPVVLLVRTNNDIEGLIHLQLM
jgi:hypothetical protein